MSRNLPWMQVANSTLGIKESKNGKPSNPKIMSWVKVVGIGGEKIFTSDKIPWCGLWLSYIFAEVGIRPVDKYWWALNWRSFGIPLDKNKPVYGAVAVFTRQSGGHVGVVVGHDSTTLHILGGNQSDSVNVSRIAKSRCVALRWPAGMKNYPPGPVLKHTAFKGPLSINEA